MRAPRVSYELHNGAIPAGLFVLHSCDNPGCVNPAHLHLGTRQDNADEAVQRGRIKLPGLKCQDHPQAVLTDDRVREIRRLWIQEKMTQTGIARLFGVHVSTVHLIVHRKTWAGLNENAP